MNYILFLFRDYELFLLYSTPNVRVGDLRLETTTDSVPIWLDNVACSGTETNIGMCEHGGWGVHNCNHDEDVNIVCLPSHINTATTPAVMTTISSTVTTSMLPVSTTRMFVTVSSNCFVALYLFGCFKIHFTLIKLSSNQYYKPGCF